MLFLAALAGLGCGGGGRPPAAAADPRPAAAAAATGDQMSSAPPTAPASSPLERADCARLLEHYLELELVELGATRPPEEVPTADQVATIRSEMTASGMDGCVGAPRPPFDCAMAAVDKPALRACLGPAEAK